MKKTIKRAAMNVRIEEDLDAAIKAAALARGAKAGTLARELIASGLVAMGYYKPTAPPSAGV